MIPLKLAVKHLEQAKEVNEKFPIIQFRIEEPFDVKYLPLDSE